MSKPDRALTIRDPWLWAIVYCDKRIENRTWSTNYRGRIYLHSAKALAPRADREKCMLLLNLYGEAMADLVRTRAPDYFQFAPMHLVATADVVDCVKVGRVMLSRTDPTHPDRWGVPDHYHWVLENVQRLREPIPMPGKLGLWRVDV